MTELLYNYGAIEMMASAISGFTSETESTLGNVDKVFRTMISPGGGGGWEGQGAMAFDGCSAAWHQSAANMQVALANLARAVTAASTSMSSTDVTNAGRF